MNINGSGLGLLHDQVYQLTIEATNTIGSTSSEKIQFCKYFSTKYYLTNIAMDLVNY